MHAFKFSDIYGSIEDFLSFYTFFICGNIGPTLGPEPPTQGARNSTILVESFTDIKTKHLFFSQIYKGIQFFILVRFSTFDNVTILDLNP